MVTRSPVCLQSAEGERVSREASARKLLDKLRESR